MTAAGRRGAGAGGLPPHAARRARQRGLRLRRARGEPELRRGHAVRGRLASGCPARTSSWSAATARSGGRRGDRAVRHGLRRGHRHRGRHVPGRARVGPGRRTRRRAAAALREHPHRGLRRSRSAMRSATRCWRPPPTPRGRWSWSATSTRRPGTVGMPEGWTDAWTWGEGDGFTCGQAADLANETSTLQRTDRLRAGRVAPG